MEQPYIKVGADIFHCKNKEYLIKVDYYSNFAEIILIGQSTATTKMRKFKESFARYGIPEILITDNGP